MTVLFVLTHAQNTAQHVVGAAIERAFRGDSIPRYRHCATVNIFELNVIRPHVVADSHGGFPHQGRVRVGAGREGDNSDEESNFFISLLLIDLAK